MYLVGIWAVKYTFPPMREGVEDRYRQIVPSAFTRCYNAFWNRGHKSVHNHIPNIKVKGLHLVGEINLC
jgi:hypothetical protein